MRVEEWQREKASLGSMMILDCPAPAPAPPGCGCRTVTAFVSLAFCNWTFSQRSFLEDNIRSKLCSNSVLELELELELELAKENCTAVPTGKFLSRRKEEDEVEAELMEMDNESKSNFSTIAMKRASTGLLFGCVLFLLLLLLVVLVMIVVEDFNAMLYIFPLLDITSASSYPLSSSFWSFDCEKCILSRESD